jgi:histidinol-phosphate aminotransferase
MPLPPELLDSIRNSVTPEFLGCYPEVYKIYDALSRFHGISPDSVLVAAGSDGAIRAAYDAFVRKGDRVINIQPNFAMYDVYSRIKQAVPVDIHYHPGTLSLDINEITGSLSRKTSLLVLSNPNSPTGVEIPQADIEVLLETAREYGTRVLIDEAYYPFSPITSLNFISRFDNVIILRTFSKAFGLASLRVGYALSSRDIIQEMATFRPMYEINAMGVLCACTLLENHPLVERFVRSCMDIKKEFCENVGALGLTVIPSSTNFVNIVVGKENVQDLIGLFRKNRILIRPGYPWGLLEECIRISIGKREEMNTVFSILKRWKNEAA